MRNFRDLDIWKRSFALVKVVYILTHKLPKSEQYGLKSQINRSAVSIPSNIAEGCGGNSNIELRRYLSIALGSSFELETQLLLVKDLFEVPDLDKTLTELNEIQRMISGYRKYLDT